MSVSDLTVSKSLLKNCMGWFLPELNRAFLAPLSGQIPSSLLPKEIQAIVSRSEQIVGLLEAGQEAITVSQLVQNIGHNDYNRLLIFKQAILRYRRERARYVEGLLGKTFHLGLTAALQQEIVELDALTSHPAIHNLETVRLPRLSDYLSIEYTEALSKEIKLRPRQYDEKFHILQAPTLFLPDLAYFRAKCEARETSLAIAFLDIDNFKQFNTDHTEPKVDRNLLPRFMQAIEGHVYHHGYAYRQGGDEYLILLPSLSRELAIAFLDELRLKVAALEYPDITGKTTISVGVCIAEPDCPLTDRELRDRAATAKKHAKDNGRNRIATCEGTRLKANELKIVKP